MTSTALRHPDPATSSDLDASRVNSPPAWWCPLCATEVAPWWLGRSERVAYHCFGSPPFVARHALVPVRDR
ncbi:hypothetical protein OHA72_45275 [Dactylosporangium sp. NBC_01737]|uniref:hypothetical protein n=1 Tax=Dactylosporangium sp. NBC_01737 TaxID=2975959 RepID=UPI002E0E8BED|nr:hypothetical protein OHA72_45275 [Dactylosporangium sp. NBC_01737]